MRTNSNRKNVILGLIAVLFVLGFLILNQPAHAALYNPHPTPTNNSVTSAMLVNSSVVPSKISTADTYTFANILAGLFTASTGVFTTAFTAPASTTFNGVQFKWPAAQGNTNTVLSNDGSGNLSWGVPSSGSLSENFTAGESISKGDAVSMGKLPYTSILQNNPGALGSGIVLGVGQIVSVGSNFTTLNDTTSIASTSIEIFDGSSLATNATTTISIYDTNSSGLPISPSLGSATVINNNFTGGSTNIYIFNSLIPLSPNTTYTIVLNSVSSPYIITLNNITTQTTPTYTSTTSVIPTTLQTYGVDFIYTINGGIPGNIYKSNSTTLTSRLFTSYLGIAQNSGASGSLINVAFSGIETASTTLSLNQAYYLTDTSGLIATTTGTNVKKIGYSLSTSKMYLTPATF